MRQSTSWPSPNLEDQVIWYWGFRPLDWLLSPQFRSPVYPQFDFGVSSPRQVGFTMPLSLICPFPNQQPSNLGTDAVSWIASSARSAVPMNTISTFAAVEVLTVTLVRVPYKVLTPGTGEPRFFLFLEGLLLPPPPFSSGLGTGNGRVKMENTELNILLVL